MRGGARFVKCDDATPDEDVFVHYNTFRATSRTNRQIADAALEVWLFMHHVP